MFFHFAIWFSSMLSWLWFSLRTLRTINTAQEEDWIIVSVGLFSAILSGLMAVIRNGKEEKSTTKIGMEEGIIRRAIKRTKSRMDFKERVG